jgi:hypothetical protein
MDIPYAFCYFALRAFLLSMFGVSLRGGLEQMGQESERFFKHASFCLTLIYTHTRARARTYSQHPPPFLIIHLTDGGGLQKNTGYRKFRHGKRYNPKAAMGIRFLLLYVLLSLKPAI